MDTDFRAWIGRTEQALDPMAFVPAQAVQAMLDDAALALVDGDLLPPLWHWFYFLPRAPQTELDEDGHPRRGGFLPPIPFARRMFAGARITVHRPLTVGAPATREGTVRDVVIKSGKSGTR